MAPISSDGFMDAELVALASSGATALVSLLVTDGWKEAKGLVVQVFRRHGHADTSTIEADLESARAELIEAHASQGPASEADLEAEWRSRFRHLLASQPDSEEELRDVVAKLLESAAVNRPATANLHAHAENHSHVYQVGHGDMHIGKS